MPYDESKNVISCIIRLFEGSIVVRNIHKFQERLQYIFLDLCYIVFVCISDCFLCLRVFV